MNHNPTLALAAKGGQQLRAFAILAANLENKPFYADGVYYHSWATLGMGEKLALARYMNDGGRVAVLNAALMLQKGKVL